MISLQRHLLAIFLTTALVTALAPSNNAFAFGCYSKACEAARGIQRSKNRSSAAYNSESMRLVEKSFKVLSPKKMGHWRGRVRGEGRAKLFLNIQSGGKTVSRRFIGQLNLTSDEGPILFSFTSSLPALRRWSWDIDVVTA